MMLPQRKHLRLKDYDYGENGEYFITICTHARQNLFGKIENAKMILNKYGQIVYVEILNMEKNHCTIKLEIFVIMPNHIHCIIRIRKGQGLSLSLSAIVREIKSKSTLGILNHCKDKNIFMGKIWQRSYYDHIICNHNEYENIYRYIKNNPSLWTEDWHNIK